MAGCDRALDNGQWFRFCGETDMGQTLPALCTLCGGDFKLLLENPNLLPNGNEINPSDGHEIYYNKKTQDWEYVATKTTEPPIVLSFVVIKNQKTGEWETFDKRTEPPVDKEKKMQEHRYGKLRFQKNFTESRGAEILAAIGFFPMKVEFQMVTDTYEMYGYSPRFDILAKGWEPPEYILEIEMADDGSLVDANPRRMGEVGYYPTAREKSAIEQFQKQIELNEDLQSNPMKLQTEENLVKRDIAESQAMTEEKKEESKFKTFHVKKDLWDNTYEQAKEAVEEKHPGLSWNQCGPVQMDCVCFEAVATKDQAERSGLDWEKGE